MKTNETNMVTDEQREAMLNSGSYPISYVEDPDVERILERQLYLSDHNGIEADQETMDRYIADFHKKPQEPINLLDYFEVEGEMKNS